MIRRVLPPDHPHTLYPQIGLANTLASLSRFTEAESLLLDAVERCERSEANRRIQGQNVVNSLVELYQTWHTAEPDKGYHAKAAEWHSKLSEWQATTQPAADLTDSDQTPAPGNVE